MAVNAITETGALTITGAVGSAMGFATTATTGAVNIELLLPQVISLLVEHRLLVQLLSVVVYKPVLSHLVVVLERRQLM